MMDLSDTPPLTPPYYADLGLARPEGDDPAGASRFVINCMADVPALSPRWQIEDGPAFSLVRTRHERDLVTELAVPEIGVSVVFDTHPSGYVRVTARRGGVDLIRAWLDRPYEEYDLWPSGAVFPERRTEDAPGRIGKRLSWIVLDSRVWPALAPLANEVGFVMARALD
jgi:hypothetical protein